MKLSRLPGLVVLVLGFWAGCAKPPAPPAPPPAVTLVPGGEKSAHFDAVNRHLELGGGLYGYADIDGDADRLADTVQAALTQLLQSMPDLKEASQLQLKPIFRALGIDDLKAVGFSSIREANGEFRNRVFLSTPQGRHGLMAIVGGAPSGPHHLGLAPEDTDVYEEIEFDVPALVSAVKQVLIAVKGKAEVDKMQQTAETAGGGMGVSPLDVVHALKGRFTAIVRIDPVKTVTWPGVQPLVTPKFAVLVGIDGLAKPLRPALDKIKLMTSRQDGGRTYYTPTIPTMVDGFHPALVVDGDDLYLGTDEFFAHECFNRPAGEGLMHSPDYQRLIKELGPSVNSVVYATPHLFKELKRLAALNPNAPAQTRQMFTLINAFPEFSRPIMTVSQNLPDGVLVSGRTFRSLKPVLLSAAFYNPVTLFLVYEVATQRSKLAAAQPASSAAAANPAAPRRPMPMLTPDQRVVRNLQLLKILSDSYYRRTGADTVEVEELTGAGKRFPALVPVEGEDYHTVKLKKDQPIEITLPDGRTLRYAPPVRQVPPGLQPPRRIAPPPAQLSQPSSP